MIKRTIATLALSASVLVLAAQTKTAREEIRDNPFLAGSNYVDYDRQLPADLHYTKAPKGYVPFYFSHYGRHGSRWLIGKNDYVSVLRPLRKARQQGKLTREAQAMLRELEVFHKTTDKRLGDLTTVGERQHHGIGRRIAANFPEIFRTKGVAIDARSTIVERCILSMMAECEELMAANPTARIHNDVSKSLQYYLNQERDSVIEALADNTRGLRRDFAERHTHPERLMQVLFNDRQWAADSVRQGALMRDLFKVAVNMQSHDGAPDLMALFTNDELYDQWRIANQNWYLTYGPAPQSGGLMPFSQYNLLRNIIQTADTCVALGKPQATMRFGHEVCVMPLACLMELDSCGVSVDDLETLDLHWRNYKIFPMGCNIQLIFYKPKKGSGPVLVKALLNEREATLPAGQTDTPYYYRWDDLRNYWNNKLNKYKQQQ